jgi:hypothetical protein
MVPAPSYSGRTELKCIFCDKLDPNRDGRAEQMGGQPARSTYFRENALNELASSTPFRRGDGWLITFYEAMDSPCSALNL